MISRLMRIKSLDSTVDLPQIWDRLARFPKAGHTNRLNQQWTLGCVPSPPLVFPLMNLEWLSHLNGKATAAYVIGRSEFWTILQNKSRKQLNSDLEGFSGLLN